MNTSPDQRPANRSHHEQSSKNSPQRTGGASGGDPPRPPRYNPDQMLGTARVAEILGLSQRCVIDWCQMGRIKARKIGKQWKIRRGDLDDYLRGCDEPTDDK